MKIVLITLAFLVSNSLFAKDSEYEYPGYEKHNINRSAPQIFLFNNEGGLLYYTEGFDPALKNAFERTVTYGKSEEIRNNIENLLQIKPDFENYEFTLFYTSYSPTVGPCPPCVKQEKILDMLKAKFNKKNISYNKILLKQPHEYVPNNIETLNTEVKGK